MTEWDPSRIYERGDVVIAPEYVWRPAGGRLQRLIRLLPPWLRRRLGGNRGEWVRVGESWYRAT